MAHRLYHCHRHCHRHRHRCCRSHRRRYGRRRCRNRCPRPSSLPSSSSFVLATRLPPLSFPLTLYFPPLSPLDSRTRGSDWTTNAGREARTAQYALYMLPRTNQNFISRSRDRAAFKVIDVLVTRKQASVNDDSATGRQRVSMDRWMIVSFFPFSICVYRNNTQNLCGDSPFTFQ